MTIGWLRGRCPGNLSARWEPKAKQIVRMGALCLLSVASVAQWPRAIAQPAHARPVQADASYLGSQSCQPCHAAIASSFSRSSMGRSMVPATPDAVQHFGVPQSFYNSTLDRHYAIAVANGTVLQSEWQLAADGHAIFRDTHPLRWIIGADANGFGGIVDRQGYLTEAPASYYPSIARWDLSPGYQRGDYGFNRIVAPGCIFCHSGRPRPVAGVLGKYQEPAFSQLAIGCENCHGPGSAHIQAMNAGKAWAPGKDPTIVNPEHLSRQRSDEICMSCHQTGDARAFEPGKSYLDFRPGQPLQRVMAILMVPPTPEHPPTRDHVQHYYSMILSKCYRASLSQPTGQQMRCITCHDPHVEPTHAEAPAWFNSRCLQCHTRSSCTEPAALRHATTPADNCIGCHMPKRDDLALSHSALTNHRIVRNASEPFPAIAFHQTTAALPDLIDLDSEAGMTPSPLTLLDAYDQLRRDHPQYQADYDRLLTRLAAQQPQNAHVLALLGHREWKQGSTTDARTHLLQSAKLDANQPAVYADLSAIDAKLGHAESAVAFARQAANLDPFNENRRHDLVLRMIDAQQYPQAVAVMQQYLAAFPEDAFLRKALAIASQP